MVSQDLYRKLNGYGLTTAHIISPARSSVSDAELYLAGIRYLRALSRAQRFSRFLAREARSSAAFGDRRVFAALKQAAISAIDGIL